MQIRRIISALAISIALVAVFAAASPASAHPHRVITGNGEAVIIANGQNHAPFVYNEETDLLESCGEVGVNEDPAAYGIETAHHGPDLGTPGKADGCYAGSGAPGDKAPPDTNPAID